MALQELWEEAVKFPSLFLPFGGAWDLKEVGEEIGKEWKWSEYCSNYKEATSKKTSFKNMVDLKSSLNNSDVEGFSKTEVDIIGNTTELSNSTNSLEANISLELKEPFVVQNGKVSNE